MTKWLSVVLSAGLLLYPFAGFAQDYGPPTAQKQQAPPVAQTLVREGDFAIKLAAELKLGNPENEAAAEDMLAKAGISPLNGWISDYPVTPEIVGQLGDSITEAAGQGKLPMSAEEGKKGLYSLASEMSLPTPAGPGAGTAPVGPSNPMVVNNYYYDQGPPVISYYPPPPYYGYLYDWVPYPAFWFGFWWPGFYMCHSFTTTVFVTNTPFVNRKAIVSNQVIHPVTRAVTVVDPVVRTSSGAVRPVTALRTGSGQMFRTTTDMSRGVTMSGVSPVRTGTAISGSRAGTGGYRTVEARKGAQAIYSRSVQGMSGGGTQRAVTHSSGTHNTAPVGAGRSYNRPVMNGGGYSRSYVAPSATHRSYVGGYSRSYVTPSTPHGSYGGGYGRSYVAPSAPHGSYGGSTMRGGGATRSGGTGWR